MRDYAKVLPTFWTTGSGKRLRKYRDARLVALYLATCTAANMIGLYPLALPTIAHELDMTVEEVRKALQRTSEAGFAHYDEEAELVWVPNAAATQIAERMKATDNRVKGVLRELKPYAKHRFAQEFFSMYAAPFSLARPEWLPSPIEGASEALRSQDQDQDQEQEQDLVARSPSGPKIVGAREGVQVEPSGVHRSARPRDPFVGSFIGPAWARGVASATGGDAIAPTGGELDAVVQTAYASSARQRPDDDPAAWAESDGALYGRAEVAAGKVPSGWRYRDWARNNRKGATVSGQVTPVGRPRREIQLPPRPGPRDGSRGAA